MNYLVIIYLLSTAMSLVACDKQDDNSNYGVHISGPSLQNISVACTSSEQCQERFKNSRCYENKCVCRESSDSNIEASFCTLNDALNVTTKKFGVIGRACKRDSDCGFENSYCNITRFQCYCKLGFTADTGGHHCLQVIKNINGTCEDNKQCLATFANSTCKDNQCLCKSGSYFEETENKCLLISGTDSLFHVSTATIILFAIFLVIHSQYNINLFIEMII